MTQPQSGIGTTPERARRGKVETTETINAGEIAQRERWPDIVAFLLDDEIGLLFQDEAYGWQAFMNLQAGGKGNGSGGEGWHHTELLKFQKLIGHKHLTVLHALVEYPVPQYGNDRQVDESRWRLSRCLHYVKAALRAAEGAAQSARDEINKHKQALGIEG